MKRIYKSCYADKETTNLQLVNIGYRSTRLYGHAWDNEEDIRSKLYGAGAPFNAKPLRRLTSQTHGQRHLVANNHGRAVRYCSPLNFSEPRTAPLCRHSHIGFDKVLCLRRLTFSGQRTAPPCTYRRGPRSATPISFSAPWTASPC